MKSRAFLFTLLLVSSVAGWSCANDPGAAAARALEESGISGIDTDWQEDRQALHLRGAASSRQVREEAEAIATGALARPGRVINDVTVAGEEIPLDAEDGEIRHRLDRLIARELPPRAHLIEVHVVNGAVTLTGEVASGEEKRRVAELARLVNGVRDVANAVEVRGHRATS